MNHLTSVVDVIRTLGGRQAVAELTGVSVKAVALWRWQSEFPAKTYVVLRDALAKRGCSVDQSLFSFIEANEAEDATP